VALVCIVFLWHVRRRSSPSSRCPSLSFCPSPDVSTLSHVEHHVARRHRHRHRAMVDSAIIMVENAHKSLERWSEERQSDDPAVRSHALTLSRSDVIIAAAKSVGRRSSSPCLSLP